MNLLQIPIIDEYWVPTQDPAATNRSKDYAIEMGFGQWRGPVKFETDKQATDLLRLPHLSSLLDSRSQAISVIIHTHRAQDSRLYISHAHAYSTHKLQHRTIFIQSRHIGHCAGRIRTRTSAIKPGTSFEAQAILYASWISTSLPES